MSEGGGEMLEMGVVSISLDPNSGAAVLVLKDAAGRTLPICIGVAEATSIAKELEDLELPRPLTHDLLRAVIEELGGAVLRVEVVALRENTYYAELVLRDPAGAERRLDCRPSDAIALAVRVRAPIFVHEQVFRKSGGVSQEFPWAADKNQWKKLLEEMDPEDFGKYKL